jgi:hypothetical protein
VKYIVPAAVAIGVGLVVLMSYFIEDTALAGARIALVDWAVTLAGLAVIVGVLNLLLVHLRKIQDGKKGWIYSVLLVATVIMVALLGQAETFIPSQSEITIEPGGLTNVAFSGILFPAQAALGGLVAIFLIYAAVRLVRTRPTLWTVGFLLVVLVVLVGWLPLTLTRPIGALREWLITVPAAAGARGIVIGIALATVVVGARVLMGIERPYKD